MKVGVDLGGSHIGMGIIDDNGRILEKNNIVQQLFKIFYVKFWKIISKF